MAFCDRFSGAVLIASPDGKVTYWSPAAAAEFGWSEIEARELGIQGLFSTADEAPAALLPGEPPGLDTASRGVKVRLKSGKAVLFESQIVPLADAGGGSYGHLYVLRPVENNGKATGHPGQAPAVPAGSTGQRALHQLNNIFASIHSSLDLALGAKLPAEVQSFLLQAQASARKGAQFVNDSWLRGWELPGLADPKTGDLEPKAAGHPEHLAEPSPESLEGSERVLVAEDDNSLRVLIRAMLTYRGYKVVEAVNGADAVSKYRTSGPFDLVILDMAMPKLDGAEALKQIRAQDSAARVLALSGTPFDSQVELKRSGAKFDGFLNKPFRNIDLLQVVRRILDHA